MPASLGWVNGTCYRGSYHRFSHAGVIVHVSCTGFEQSGSALLVLFANSHLPECPSVHVGNMMGPCYSDLNARADGNMTACFTSAGKWATNLTIPLFGS